MPLTNKTLIRQIKRTLGIASVDELSALLASANTPDAIGSLLNRLPLLLEAVAESYEQYDRNAALQARSMEISSAELVAANERLRAEALEQQQVLDTLHQTTAELLGEAWQGPSDDHGHDAVALTRLISSLVAERERAVEALRENDRKLRSLIENVPGCVYRLQPESTLVFDFISDGILALSGYTAAEFMADAEALHSRCVGEDMAAIKRRSIGEAVRAGRSYELEYEMQQKGGGSCWVLERGQGAYDEHGTLISIDGLLLDNSATYMARQALQRSSMSLTVAIESIEQGFAMFDAEDRLFTLNSALLRMYPALAGHFMPGTSQEEIVRLYFRTTPPQERAANPAEFFADDEDAYLAEWRRRRHRVAYDAEIKVGGRWIHQQQTITGDGTTVILHTDITALKQLNLELVRSKEAAEAANHAKTEFLANMSHEIRTPMNGIIGLTDLTLETELNEEQRSNLALVKSSADQLLAIVNQILDFSKIEAGQVETEHIAYSLSELVDSTVRLAALQGESKGLRVEAFRAPSLDDTQYGDPTRIRQILTNLLNNAIKFTEAGSVTVQVMPASEEGLIQFSVRDSGIGIAPDRLAHIFAPFSQADTSTTRRYGGTGLGLAICRDLAELLGGRIWVESTPGQGSAFYFTIARHQTGEAATATTAAGDDRHIAAVAAMPLSVLVVDDSDVNRQVATRMLQKQAQWQVHAVDSGFAALDLLKSRRFDVILMDLNMPDMGGLETTQRLRKQEIDAGQPPVPVVALTASAFENVKGECFASGMTGFASKPIRQAELLRTIAEQVLKGVPSPAPAPSPTPHAAELDCFDPHKLLASLEGDMPFLISLVRVYIDDTAKRMSALDDQLVEGDATEALQTAHAIKGGSSSLGAHAMATFAERMEQCLRAGRIDDAISYQQKLNHAFQQVCVNIANFLAADHADTPILDG